MLTMPNHYLLSREQHTDRLRAANKGRLAHRQTPTLAEQSRALIKRIETWIVAANRVLRKSCVEARYTMLLPDGHLITMRERCASLLSNLRESTTVKESSCCQS